MSYLDKVYDQLGKLKSCSQGFVLMGAGPIGAMALVALRDMGLPVHCFIDNDVQKQGKTYEGTEVLSVKAAYEAYRDCGVVICVGSSKTHELLHGQLLENKFSYFYNLYPLAHYFLEKNLYHGLDNELAKDISMNIAYAFPNPDEAQGFVIPQIEICVTQKCTLRCRDCANLIRYYDKPVDCDIDTTISAVKRLTEIMDHIEQVTLLGGEPFILSNFSAVLRQVRAIPAINFIKIITNATIVPSADIFTAIGETNAMVFISHYGIHSPNVDKIKRECDDRGIVCIVSKNMEWQDLGSPTEKRERSLEETTQLFEKCSLGRISTLIGNKLYRCSRGGHAFNSGVIEEKEGDSFDLDKHFSNNKVARDALTGFLSQNRALTACGYCNSFSPMNTLPTIPAAIQSGGKKNETF